MPSSNLSGFHSAAPGVRARGKTPGMRALLHGLRGSAFFWTSTQLLTVSSSIGNPISFGGRALDIFMEAYAITVIAALAGAFGSFLHKRGLELEKERAPGF